MNIYKQQREWLVFLIIVVIAIFFRFHNLDSTPPGLYPDEAMNGNNAVQATETGNYKVFYPDNNGREGFFINIQSFSVQLFGNNAWALRAVSAVFGVLTVIGLYLLTRELFGWHQAALAGFLMAISFWHVNFSRIGFRAIMLPFILVFAFYFFWRGLKKGNLLDFLLSGLFWGLGFHTYISYRVAPFIVVAILANHWFTIRKDFSGAKYEETKKQILLGLVILGGTALVVALPIFADYLNSHDHFLSRTGRDLSVFGQDNPLKELFLSVVKTLGMFNFSGDYNWRHNISGWPELSLPIGILFLIGFLKELFHWLKVRHGHPSTIHTFLFSWFFVMLLPGFLSTEAPHALRTIGVIPVVMIFAARGLYWLLLKLYRWHSWVDPHVDVRESRVLVFVAMMAFLASLGFLEYWRYFKVWAVNQEVSGAFNRDYTELAAQLNVLIDKEPNLKKYVLVNVGGVLVNDVPMPAQTIMFLTDTFTPQKQSAKNLFYVTEEQCRIEGYPTGGIIFPMKKM